ncbi:MAG: DUF167 domain-containing protein, partial [Deltaproteobacteria bacterium]|nr:DUF167 domain-containing protein [Deltaproteobacteria bacterium]
MPFMQENTHGVKFKIFVQPRSSKNTIAGLYGDALKIKLTAPPVDNAANKMCVKFLAKCLQVPKSRVEILSGHTGRTKLLLLRYADEKSTTRTEKERIKQQISALF